MEVQKRHIKRWAFMGLNRFLFELFLIYVPVTLEKEFILEGDNCIILSLTIALIVLIIEKYLNYYPKYNTLFGSPKVTVVLSSILGICLFRLYGMRKWLKLKIHY